VITTQAILAEARSVFRQEVNLVDLPPRVLVSAFNNALEKEEISPIIYFELLDLIGSFHR
jgi:hypothetical protein